MLTCMITLHILYKGLKIILPEQEKVLELS